MEEPEIVADLRTLNKGKSRYDQFWEECEKYINENTAVNDRRHGNVTHLAIALSVRDFVEQVKSRCSSEVPIPSLEWVRLQFWPKTPNSKAALHHTGRLQVKFKIQQRQWRHYHVDSHYAAAYFRYMREYAIMVREHCIFVCLDDKHKVKIGEPQFPVAAAERGRRVPVATNQSFQAGDHDFTKFGIIPSVIFIIDVPDEVEESWYAGTVFVGLKDTAFEPSSPLRHSVELYNTLISIQAEKKILFLYTDGGPDHRLTYLSVQISLICLFLNLDLDFLCACRTAPYHIYKNPVERVMAILNLGLQCVALARAEMPEEYEAEVKKCNNLNDIRKTALRKDGISSAVKDSLSPVKVLLCSVFTRLQIKEKNIRIFHSASLEEISQFWSAMLSLDKTLEQHRKYVQEELGKFPLLSTFMDHCCQKDHYFGILKCGNESCSICKPVCLPLSVFTTLKHLPHPIPQEDGHYKPFREVYGTKTSGKFRPSSLKKKTKSKGLPFYASVQHVTNAQIMLQCESCNMWHLVFSKYKLSSSQRQLLQELLGNLTYTCGSQLKDANLPEELANVEVWDHQCRDPIEKLYYSAKFEPICIYCGEPEPYTTEGQYPQCNSCKSLPPIMKNSKK